MNASKGLMFANQKRRLINMRVVTSTFLQSSCADYKSFSLFTESLSVNLLIADTPEMRQNGQGEGGGKCPRGNGPVGSLLMDSLDM